MKNFVDALGKSGVDFNYILTKIQPSTPFGMRLKKDLKPFGRGEEAQLIEELNRVEIFVSVIKSKKSLASQLRGLLGNVKDLTSSVLGCANDVVLTEVELYEIKNFLYTLRKIKDIIDNMAINIPEDMYVTPIDYLEKLLDPQNSGVNTFYIYDDYSERLKAIRQEKKELERKRKREEKKIKDELKKTLNISVRPDGSILVSKGNKSVIEGLEKNPFVAYSSETYLDIKYSIRGNDYITNIEKKIEELKWEQEKEEFEIRQQLSKEIAKYKDQIIKNMESIGKIDFTLAKASLAVGMNCIKPVILNEHRLKIIQGRHPKVEEALRKRGLIFTPISVDIKEGVTCITGANMGGKTVSLKLIGLLSTMAQSGMFVPCREMETGLNDFINVCIGDWQSTEEGLSTFGSEIKGIQKAIERKGQRGLILIDELARGTNPQEGYAISKSVVKYLLNEPSMTVITTHYDNIANMNGVVHLQVIGLSNVNFDDIMNQIEDNPLSGIEVIAKYMDYRLMRVKERGQTPRDALNIARLMGLENSIVEYAEKILMEEV